MNLINKLQKQRIFKSESTAKYEEVLVYYGDDRGNIRIIDISDSIMSPSGKPIKKAEYYPEQKVSFIPKRKGDFTIDKIGESLIKLADSFKPPNPINYNYLLVESK